MNKKLLQSRVVYPEILLFWGDHRNQSEIRLHDKTLGEAYNIAIEFGYRPPVWYKPWEYITRGIGVLTIGWGVEK